MTVLQALDRYYGRMVARGEAEALGYSREKISFAIVLAADGAVLDVQDLRTQNGKKLQPRLLEVPAASKRTVAIAPNTFWDKTAYVLGRTAGDGKRTAREHAAFVAMHRDLLNGTEDAGLLALDRFLTRWTPADFDAAPFTVEMLDANFVFRLDGEMRFLHERPAAQRLIAARQRVAGLTDLCLVTGEIAPIARLHPTIKGVDGAQSAGAALVSFNLDAFTSYGKEQGANAPTSEAAAFRYGAALNRMLDRGTTRHRIKIADTTVAFWADAEGNEAAAAAAEDIFAELIVPASDESETDKVKLALQSVAKGRAEGGLDLGIAAGARFHVLGLAPNAARLSVRFWLEDRFEVFAERLAQHYRDLQILPQPWRLTPPSIQRLLVKTTALQEKPENIPPLLAGEMIRAVLTGTRYPRIWLTAAITRLRAGDKADTGWHAAAIRACLVRDERMRQTDPTQRRAAEEMLVSLDRDDPHPAYLLGRLFAAMEAAQRAALGKVNATIRDRYFAAASATPAGVFPLLCRGVQNHLSKLRKEGKGGWIEREIETITDKLPAALPRTLLLEAQGRFFIGYYHQRKAQFAGRPAEEADVSEETEDAQ